MEWSHDLYHARQYNSPRFSYDNMFIFVDTDKLDSPRELKRMIFDQFGGEIISWNLTFDIGYFRNNKRVCLVSADDMEDVNKLLRSSDGHKVTLWCMGCKTKQKRKWVQTISDVDSNDSSSESERPAKKFKKRKSWYAEKLERVDETVDTLKAKHSLKYTVQSLG